MDFLGLERPVEYTGYSIFDPTTAKMVLDAQDKYFAAVYADYQQGLEDMKEFRKEYDDFITPILADQEWYNNNVTGKVRGFINDAYARGIDLTRSQEGRAALSQIINSVNVGKVAKIRQSAENAKEYIKNRGLLEASGKYNDDLERRFLGFDLSNWSTVGDGLTPGNGIWDRMSPTEMKSLKELTNDWYNNRTARDLSPEEVGAGYDRRYNYTGFLDSDLLNIARGNTPGWNNSVYSRYYRDIAEQKVAAKGEPYTQDDVERQLQRDIADAQQEWLIAPTKSADKFAEMDQQYKYNTALENLKHQNAMEEIAQKNAGKEGEGSGNYMHLISNGSSAARMAMQGQMFNEYALKHPEEVANRLTLIGNLNKQLETEKDPAKIAKINKKIQDIQNRMAGEQMSSFLLRKNEDGKTTPYSILTNLGEGQAGVYQINDILKNRSINGDIELDPLLVLSRSGFGAPDEDGWSKVTRTSGRILSPHQIMTNILNHESGNGVKLRTKSGNIITQKDIIKQIEQNASEEGFWEASTNARLSRTDKVQSLNEYISAPDENGVYHVYMKVAIQQGARLNQPGSWLPKGEHNGFWVETNITQLPNGTVSTESNPSIFGAGLRQRKEFTNAASESEYGSIRY